MQLGRSPHFSRPSLRSGTPLPLELLGSPTLLLLPLGRLVPESIHIPQTEDPRTLLSDWTVVVFPFQVSDLSPLRRRPNVYPFSETWGES